MNLETIATQWMSAFNAKDIEALLELYAEDAVHYSPKLKIREPHTEGYIRGKSQMRKWWTGAFERMPDLVYQTTALTASANRVFMEYKRIVPGERDLLVAEVLEVIHGKITASRVYHG